jgi:hypothetical protein
MRTDTTILSVIAPKVGVAVALRHRPPFGGREARCAARRVDQPRSANDLSCRACPVGKQRVFETDSMGRFAWATTILPFATVTMPPNTFCLASIDSDILQDVIVERLQSGDRRPYSPRATQARPKSGHRGRDCCSPTQRSSSRLWRLPGLLDHSRISSFQPWRVNRAKSRLADEVPNPGSARDHQ